MPEISQVSFAAYCPAPGLDTRLSLSEDPNADIRSVATQLRREFGIPFWDAILSVAMKRGAIPSRYVDLAILHDSAPNEKHFEVSRSNVTEGEINSLVSELKPGFALAVSSKVKLSSGATAHIPMMDFRCSRSPMNATIVKKALGAMGEKKGILLDSGRSYHFYGSRLLSEDAWIKFLALAILFTPVVDARYIAHRLVDGACRLRIGTGPDKPATPIVEEVF